MKKLLLTLGFLITWGLGQDSEVEIEIPVEEPAPIETMPSVKTFKEAAYPTKAIEDGAEGVVRLEIVISDSGSVDSIKVLEGIHPQLDSAAVWALQNSRFNPAIAGGEPIAVALEYEYRFSLASLVETIPEYVNFTGIVKEKGTRSPVKETMVVVTLLNPEKDPSIKLPLDLYLNKVASFEGQFMEEGRIVTTTDGEGKFSFKSLPACSIKVSIPATGYRPASFTELLENGKQIEVEYRIARESYDEYEIVVYGKAEKVEVAKKTLSVSEIKRVPGFGGDAIKVVRALPGVARPSFISGDVIIRGSGSEDTRFYLDGVRVPHLFHFGGLRSVYSSDLLSSIDMYPGGFSSRYGGAVGGVVEVKGRSAKSDRWHGKVDINLMDAAALMEGPVSENLSLQAAGRYSYIGKFIESATENTPMTVIPVYADAYARLDWKLKNQDKAFLTYSASKDKLELYSSEIRGGSQEVEENTSAALADEWYQMALLGWDKTVSPKLRNELRLSLTKSYALASAFGFQKIEFNQMGVYLRDELQYSPAKSLMLKPGLDVDFESIDYSLNILGGKGFRDNKDVQYFSASGAYLNAEWKLGNNILIMPGIRYDYFADIEEGQPSYRLTSRWQYTKGLTLKGSAGSYSQAPKPWGQATDEAWGNPDLPATKAYHYVGGHEWQISDLVSLDLQGYYNYQYDIPNYTDSINPVSGESVNFIPDMEGRMYGMEMMLRHDQGSRFFGWISYSLSRSERRTGGPFTVELARATSTWDPDKWVVSQFDQTHNLQVLGSWRLPRQWETGFRFRYVTGNPTTPRKSYTDNEFEYNSEYLDYVNNLGDAYSDRMGPFLQLDLRVDKKFVFNSWMLSTYLDFRNVNYFFYNSPEFYDYNYDGSKRESVGAIFLPSFGITAEF